MQIMFINNNGSGFADTINIAQGTTVNELFEDKIGGDVENYNIRVNRDASSRDQVLQENDHVSMTPTKIEGA